MKRKRVPGGPAATTVQSQSSVATGHSSLSSMAIMQEAASYLEAADPRLSSLIQTFGPPERLLAKSTPCFRSLAKSILYQQLAGTAAAAIYARFLAVCGVADESQLTPAAVLAVPTEALRGCGLSGSKASYLQDLAGHFADGRLSDEQLLGLDDDGLRSALTAVRGIGPWTVDMFAMFHLGRPDVLPVGDLGVRKGLAHLCGLSHLPSPSEMESLTAAWRPYRSLGCYYMWRIPLPPAKRANNGKANSNKAATARANAVPKTPKVKAPKAAITSPLGAAVAAVADVGVNAAAPMLAAASGAAGVRLVASCWGCGKGEGGQAGQMSEAATQLPPITPPQRQQGRPETPAAAAAVAAPVDEGDDGNVAAAAAAVADSQIASSGHGSSSSDSMEAAATAVAGGHSMVTRRRLKWAGQGGEPHLLGRTQQQQQAGVGGLKPRIVDL